MLSPCEFVELSPGWSTLGFSVASSVHEAIAQQGFKYKKGKNKQSFSKKPHVVVPATIILSEVCVYTHKHTLWIE